MSNDTHETKTPASSGRKRRRAAEVARPLIVRPFSPRELSEAEVAAALAGGQFQPGVCAVMQSLEQMMGALNLEGHRGNKEASAGFLALQRFYEEMWGLAAVAPRSGNAG